MMHIERKKAIKSKIKALISGADLNKDNYIDDKFIKTLSEIKTFCKKEQEFSCISNADISDIVFSEIINQTISLSETEKSDDEFKLLKKNIIVNIYNSLLSMPQIYQIKLNIPIFNGNIKFNMGTLEIPFCSHNERNKKTGHLERYLSVSSEQNNNEYVGLTFEVEGYLKRRTNKTFNKAISYIKLIIQRGLANQIYLIGKEKKPFFKDDIPSVLYKQQDLKHVPFYFLSYKLLDSDEFTQISLSDELSDFFDRLEINLDNKGLTDDLENNRTDFLNQTIKEVNFLSNKENINLKSILSAIEWYINAYSYENRNISFAFLQICFGLEALFSDDPKLITKTLSLKCAYSIARSVQERTMIVSLIKDIYELRSKIVHGSKLGIDDDDFDLYGRGKALLSLSINNEVKLAINNSEEV